MVNANDFDQSAEKEVADVVVVLNVSTPAQAQDAVAGLRAIGLTVVRTDEENGVVEGTLDPRKLVAVRALPTVKYARLRFEYMATLPTPTPPSDAPGAG